MLYEVITGPLLQGLQQGGSDPLAAVVESHDHILDFADPTAGGCGS